MFQIEQTHTAELAEIRQLLCDAYDGRFEDADWEHTVGGNNILLRERGELVGHASVVQRRLYTQELAVRTGYVEGSPYAKTIGGRVDRRSL